MIDFEKVDMQLLNMIMLFNGFENNLMNSAVGGLPGATNLVKAIDEFRQQLSLEIERQGARLE